MAPTLTSSNSSLLTPSPRSRLLIKNPRSKTLIFGSATGKNPSPFPPLFRAAKQEETKQSEPAKKKPFFIDFPGVQSLIPVNQSSALSFGNQRRKDSQTVFVAGATGQSGIRITQSLLRQGFSVRAGVPELAAAQDLARLAAQYKIISSEESKRLNAVESTFGDAESIARAIGNAGKVVITVGPAENGPTTEVTTTDALQVVQAAQLAGVKHVVVVYESSLVNSSTYNVLDGLSSFFNNLLSRNLPLTLPEFLAKVVETDISYTLLKASMTDDYSPENSYSLVLSPERSDGGSNYNKVSKLQIASLVADVFSNTAVAENKVVEVATSSSAPSKPVDQLFSAIPEDGRRKAYAEAQAKAEEEAAARKAAEASKKLEQEVKKQSKKEAQDASLAEEAKEKAEAFEDILSKAKAFSGDISWAKLSSQFSSNEEKPKTQIRMIRGQSKSSLVEEDKEKGEANGTVDEILSKAKAFGKDFSWVKLSSQFASNEENSKPEAQIATIRGQTKARSLPPKKAVVKQAQPKAKQTQPKPEVKKVFGGLFTQETIYVDDD